MNNIMENFALFKLSIHSLNLLSAMIGMFIGGYMPRYRAMGVVCVYLALIALGIYLNNSMSLNLM